MVEQISVDAIPKAVRPEGKLSDRKVRRNCKVPAIISHGITNLLDSIPSYCLEPLTHKVIRAIAFRFSRYSKL